MPKREISAIAFARKPGDEANLSCILLLAGQRRPVPIPARVGIRVARVIVVDRPEIGVLEPAGIDLDAWDPW